MLCPSMLTADQQTITLERAGLERIDLEDITTHVAPTWDHCKKLVGHPLAQMVVHSKNGKLRRFVESFDLMDRGYREGALAYGMITARKP